VGRRNPRLRSTSLSTLLARIQTSSNADRIVSFPCVELALNAPLKYKAKTIKKE
jgi:hypothetical protein